MNRVHLPVTMSIAEVASYVGVTAATIKRWSNAGRFCRPVGVSSQWRFLRVDVEAFFRAEDRHV